MGHHRSDRGSSLLLFPAALLVVLTLAAIATDLALVHHGRHLAHHVAAAAADDAVMVGLDTEAFRAGGDDWYLDRALVREVVATTVAAHDLDDRLVGVDVDLSPDSRQVTVRVTLRVDYIVARALPGADHTVVSSTARAVAHLR
ncbi:MAG: hypothetical protein JJU45_19190 [Acidimicrobiia bacterium]|nr:hypothetical protein [Acidimicrobiia bacterium]